MGWRRLFTRRGDTAGRLMANGLRLLIVGWVILAASVAGVVTTIARTVGAIDSAIFTTTDAQGSTHTVTPPALGGSTAFAACSHAPGGTAVNCNRYPNEFAVWLSGGPKNRTSLFAGTGSYYFVVTDPTEKTVLSTDSQTERTFTLATNGEKLTSTGTHGWDRTNDRLQLAPFGTSKNGEYKLLVCKLTSTKSSTCKRDNFKVEIRTTPSLTTTASSATLGEAIHDTATLSGGRAPTGTITFSVYSTSSCRTLVSAVTSAVHGNMTYRSTDVTPTGTGTYFWLVRYSGDALNDSATSTCGAQTEVSQVTTNLAKPTLTTKATATARLGTPINDTATLSGGSAPTGTITFKLFSESSCSATSLEATVTKSVDGDTAYTSPGVTPPSVGTYYWQATYSGDVHNQSVETACATETEISIVSSTPEKGSPSILTFAGNSTYPTPIHDRATISGGNSPSGTITFKVYDTPRCTGTGSHLVATVTKDFNGAGSYTSPNVNPPGPAGYYWTASVPATATNNAMVSACGAANEASTVTKRTKPPNPTTPAPSLSVVKSSVPPSGSTVAPLTTVTYQLTLTNSGTATTTAVTVTDTVPSGTTYKATSASCGNAPTGCAVSETGTTVTWTGISVQPGTTNRVTVTFAVIVNASDTDGQVITDSAVFTNEGTPGCGSAATCTTNSVTVVVAVRTTSPTTSGPPKPTTKPTHPKAPTRIPGSTTVHTGEPWVGPLWAELATLAVGLGLLAFGASLRRRGRTAPSAP